MVMLGTISARDKPATVPVRLPTHTDFCWLAALSKTDIKKTRRHIFRCKAFGVLYPFISGMFVFMDGCSRGHDHTGKQRASE